jgi:hypothetical protein
MRAFFMMTILSLGVATASSAPAHAAQSQGTTPFCVSGFGCVSTTAEGYSACYQLGLQRGQNASNGDRRSFDLFIYQCLSGKIRR